MIIHHQGWTVNMIHFPLFTLFINSQTMCVFVWFANRQSAQTVLSVWSWVRVLRPLKPHRTTRWNTISGKIVSTKFCWLIYLVQEFSIEFHRIILSISDTLTQTHPKMHGDRKKYLHNVIVFYFLEKWFVLGIEIHTVNFFQWPMFDSLPCSRYGC